MQLTKIANMSRSSIRTPENDVRKGGLLAIVFGLLMGAFGLAFGAAVAQGANAIYLSAIAYFLCGLGMYFKHSRFSAVLALGLFMFGIVSFLANLSQSEPSTYLLNNWSYWSFIISFMMTVYFLGGSLVAGVRGAFLIHRRQKADGGVVGSTSI
jgi:hypothetical protein